MQPDLSLFPLDATLTVSQNEKTHFFLIRRSLPKASKGKCNRCCLTLEYELTQLLALSIHLSKTLVKSNHLIAA